MSCDRLSSPYHSLETGSYMKRMCIHSRDFSVSAVVWETELCDDNDFLHAMLVGCKQNPLRDISRAPLITILPARDAVITVLSVGIKSV